MKPFETLSPESLLNWINEQGIDYDFSGGSTVKKKNLSLQRKTSNHYLIKTNSGHDIVCLPGEKFNQTLRKIEIQTKLELFK